jgi:hypothetical protein
MEDFDFIKGFADVDILTAEAVAKVIGHVIGSLVIGMVEAGLSEEAASQIINNAVAVMFTTAFKGQQS